MRRVALVKVQIFINAIDMHNEHIVLRVDIKVDYSQRVDESIDPVVDIAGHDGAGIVEIDDAVEIGVAEEGNDCPAILVDDLHLYTPAPLENGSKITRYVDLRLRCSQVGDMDEGKIGKRVVKVLMVELRIDEEGLLESVVGKTADVRAMEDGVESIVEVRLGRGVEVDEVVIGLRLDADIR